MLSWFAKWCLAFTAISPAFGSAAITAIFVHDNWQWGIAWTVTGLVTVAIAGLLIRFAKNHVQTSSMHVNDVEPADQRVLEFLIAYLLPVFSSANLPNLAGSIILSSYSLLIVLLIVANGNMFQFNPVLSMMGYHFYIVTSDRGIEYLLISKRALHKGDRDISYKRLSEYVFLDATT